MIHRTHYSKVPLETPKDLAADAWFNGMPSGFWYFIGRPLTTRIWGEHRRERIHRYRVDVSDCRLLVIRDALEAQAAMVQWPLPPPPEDFAASILYTFGHPDWAKLAREFDGVEVPNDPRKGASHWHSLFDCPSGCLWNASKVRVERVR